VLTDQGAGEKSKIERLRASKVLEAGRVFSIAEQLGKAEADIEDILEPGLLAEIVNQAYGIPDGHKLTASSLLDFEPNTPRLVKKLEAAFKLMPSQVAEFDHFMPADWLIRNPRVLNKDTAEVRVTLARAGSASALRSSIPTPGTNKTRRQSILPGPSARAHRLSSTIRRSSISTIARSTR
jgi:hypothetical protein